MRLLTKVTEGQPRRHAERVMAATAVTLKVPLGWLKSRRRDQHTAFVRQMGMYLCRELTEASFPVISGIVNRDHSTAIHGYNLIASRAANGMSHKIGAIRREVEAYLEAHGGRENGIPEGASRPDGEVAHYF